jgi:hypothetical protein
MPIDYNPEHFKSVITKLIQTQFRQNWQFRLEIDDAPEDFDIYVKDVSYGTVVDIQTDEHEAGGLLWTYPTRGNPVTVTMTVKDHEDQRVYKFFAEWAGKVLNGDGTVNLPVDYLKDVRRFTLQGPDDDQGAELESWQMWVTQVGDVTENREDRSSFQSFPVTMVQFSNLGIKVV